MGIVANGGRHEDDGTVLFSGEEATSRLLQDELVSGEDKVLRMNVTYGRGVMIRKSINVSKNYNPKVWK